MKQREFERLYAIHWQTFAEQLTDLEQATPSSPPLDFGRNYRRICQLHAICQSRHYSSYLVDALDDLVIRGHAVLYQRKTQFSQAILRFLVSEFPRHLRAEAKLFWWMFACFYGAAIAIALAQYWNPDLIYGLMSPDQVQSMESMYNPSNQVVGEARASQTNWMMFGHYIQNNIGLAFRTFAAGVAAGVGSLFFVVYNGLMLGALASHLTSLGSSQTFFTFVIGHGSFELTAIVISGAAGLKLGLSLLKPGNQSRFAALKNASQGGVQLIMGAMVMLLIAAFIEAFWSSNNLLAPWQKYLIGSLLWIIVAAYFLFAGRRYGSH